ncbi:metabolite transport protein YdfJ [Escherichia coli]|uniref:Metabolite transport protein YdfJ n=1 Tax=Escherichia coli TaxID=562 RepID=A0A377BBN1_ECOLX|nr:metabolite transport protein YdfJ [Escherichia coli]
MKYFFLNHQRAMALILAMGTYGAGYVARIVGAFIFGKMGDRIGRKKVLFITITMMGICTTLIGVLPTYAQIGVFAPILLVTLRIIQGLGAGAEIPVPVRCWRNMRQKVSAELSPHLWLWELTAEP